MHTEGEEGGILCTPSKGRFLHIYVLDLAQVGVDVSMSLETMPMLMRPDASILSINF
jgi:hypothetical protein